MPKLHIIICSTRPQRVGPAVAQWFHTAAKQHAGFDCELVDLAEVALPILDEPNHPRMQKYQHEHTKRWSASVAAADAFVFVTPEYNFGPPPSLLNALNYLYNEWNYKPAAFVSYGGLSGGMRAVEREKGTLNTLKMVPIMEAVTVVDVNSHLKEGAFHANDVHERSAKTLLDELLRWSNALTPLRQA